MVFWSFVVPCVPVAIVFRHRKCLHQERTLEKWGWLYTSYNWYAANSELVIQLRRYLFVFLVSYLNNDLQRLLAALVMVSTGFSGLELVKRAHAEPMASYFDTVASMAIAMTCAVLILLEHPSGSYVVMTI